MLIFLFGECFSPLIILDKMIKKKKPNCWRILYQEEGRWADGVSIHTKLFLGARYFGPSAALAGDGQEQAAVMG